MPDASLVSVNLVRALVPDTLGDLDHTAIDKRPADGPVELHHTGPVGDTVMDRRHHGGRDQAVYAYAAEDLAHWSAELDRVLAPGTFGENLTTLGVDVTGAVVGERWRIEGSAGSDPVLLEVTSPRTPCATFQGWMGEPHWVRRFTEHGAPGTYLRVLTPGSVAAGAAVEVVSRPAHGVTIGEVFVLRLADPARLRLLLEQGEDLQPQLVTAVADQLRRTS
jgi:MOSC domain-containing protein YiiM